MAGESPAAIIADATTSDLAKVTATGKLQVAVEDQVIDVRLQPVPPPDLADLVNAFLEKSGGGSDMRVDGSSTAVSFVFPADGLQDIKLFGVKIFVASNDVQFQGDQFVDGDALANGCLLEVRSNDNTVELGNLKVTEDFIGLPLSMADYHLAGPKDWLAVTINFGLVIVLKGGSSDFVKLTIRDDLSGPVNPIAFTFTASISGIKV